MRRMGLLAVLVSALVLALAAPAAADREVIHEWTSLIEIQPDASLIVTETIRVRALGREIRRGIVREFPTTYTKDGLTVRVGFRVLSVKKNGKPEPYFIKSVSNGEKVFIGKSSVYLEPDEYVYTIKYRTDRQIGYFEKYDELYWNVTGTDWAFPIEKARAIVRLPPGARVVQKAAYTGPSGSKGQDFNFTFDKQSRPIWITTRTLNPGEGLTIAVAWPKGLIAEPSQSEKLQRQMLDNLSLVAAGAGLLLCLFYYLWAWFKVGRDPAKGVIIPRFAPPHGISAAGARFIMEMGFDGRTFAAALVSLAVKGHLRIEETKKVFTLRRLRTHSPGLSSGETKVANKLLGSRDSIELKNTNHATIGAAQKALKTSLKTEFEKQYFTTNGGYVWPGIIITLLTLAGVAVSSTEPGGAAGISLWLTLWSTGCYFLVSRVIMAWRSVKGPSGCVASIFITVFTIPFVGGLVAGVVLYTWVVSLPAALAMVLMILSTVIFYHLLKAPTMGGRKVMDELEGFRQYLAMAEKVRWEVLHPPEKTPELFERFLPYALAPGGGA